jgi:CHAT domain-containing protein
MGRLGYVPFCLLFPGREVVSTPSGTTLRLLKEARAEPGLGVLAFGDPDYRTRVDGTALRVRGGTMTRLTRLPATRMEVEAIADVGITGKAATETGLPAAIRKRKRWRAVHFACHGLVDPERPMLSALALTADEENDGFLTALEIFRTKVPADLVVLSACESGRGRIYKTEGVVGLARAFMFAGSRRVLCSLWKVDDEATRALMVKFYELWNPKDGGKGLGAAAALKKAQEHVRGHEKWKHPHYWAAWVLWGLPE